jgi:hypothetical protein
MKNISSPKKAYLAGFLDGDGSIYMRLKRSGWKYLYEIEKKRWLSVWFSGISLYSILSGQERRTFY